jgi:hypothetical protein
MDDRLDPILTRRTNVEVLLTTLADGNCWGLALPSSRLRPKVVHGVDILGRPTETIEVVAEFGYPLEIRRRIDDLRLACEQEPAEMQWEALIRLAAALLRRAHDIEPADAARLLELEVDDLAEFVETVLSTITGTCLETPVSVRKGDGDGRPS